MISKEKFSAIADAIRLKNGTSGAIIASDFASEILALNTIGAEPEGVGEFEMRFAYTDPVSNERFHVSRFCTRDGVVTPPDGVSELSRDLWEVFWNGVNGDMIRLFAGSVVYYDVTVPSSLFVEDLTYVEYPFRAFVEIYSVTADMLASVVFNPSDAVSGNYSPVCESSNGGLYIYSKWIPSSNLILPSIQVYGVDTVVDGSTEGGSTEGALSVDDIADNLTTDNSSKVLSAAQGVALKLALDTKADSDALAYTDERVFALIEVVNNLSRMVSPLVGGRVSVRSYLCSISLFDADMSPIEPDSYHKKGTLITATLEVFKNCDSRGFGIQGNFSDSNTGSDTLSFRVEGDVIVSAEAELREFYFLTKEESNGTVLAVFEDGSSLDGVYSHTFGSRIIVSEGIPNDGFAPSGSVLVNGYPILSGSVYTVTCDTVLSECFSVVSDIKEYPTDFEELVVWDNGSPITAMSCNTIMMQDSGLDPYANSLIATVTVDGVDSDVILIKEED